MKKATTNEQLKRKFYSNQTGITLIALVVTIVVLLILAGVSINALFGNSGIIKKAQEAQNKMNDAQNSDLNALDNLNEWVDNSINGTTGKNTPTIKTMTIKLSRGKTENTYSYEEGMTWGEWVASEYNTDGFRIVNNCICSSGSVGSLIAPSEKITETIYNFNDLFL